MSATRSSRPAGRSSRRSSYGAGAHRKKRKRIRVRSLPRLLLFFTFLILLVVCGISLRKDTEVSGLKTVVPEVYGTDVTDTITVRGSAGRYVLLEYLDSDGNWQTVEEIQTSEKEVSRVTLTYPASVCGKKPTAWRIRIRGTLARESYSSGKITVRPRNVGKDPEITAKAAVIYRLSDSYLLYGKNENQELPNASTTKIMTALISMKKLDGNDTAVMSENAVNTLDGVMYKNVGDRFKVSDLWDAMLLASSNEAAVAIAEKTSGSEAAFVAEMNAQAKKLGLKHTHYMNPHGLDEEGHYSSAYDLAKIDQQAMKLKRFRKIIRKKSVTFAAVNDSTVINILKTTNKFIKEGRKGCLGGKTGYTTKAKGCLVCNFQVDGETYVTVVLGSDDRWSDTEALVSYIEKYAKYAA